MKINWKIRLKNKYFWLTLIPALFILIGSILKCFGIEIDIQSVQDNAMSIFEALFTVLAILGIVVDPTTEGIEDSNDAMNYSEPKQK